MPIGQTRPHSVQSAHASSLRLMRVSPKREKGANTAANGHSQRQNGSMMTSEASTISPLITYAHHVMSLPCRLSNT